MYTARVKDKAIFSHKINGDIYGCWYVRIYLCILHSYQLSEFHAAFSCVFYAFLNELKLSDVCLFRLLDLKSFIVIIDTCLQACGDALCYHYHFLFSLCFMSTKRFRSLLNFVFVHM